MRFPSLSLCVISLFAIVPWSHTAQAATSVANFPDPKAPANRQPRLGSPPQPSSPPTLRSGAPHQTDLEPGRSAATPADVDARAAERRRKAWLLSVEGVTHAPLDMGFQVGVEIPQGLRFFAGYGWVPGSYMSLLTGIAANASGNSYAKTLLEDAEYQGHTWRAQVGWRPFRAIGLYGDFGYAQVIAHGSLDLASSSIPQLAMFGGGYTANTRLDMWLVELGYQGELADRIVLALALGAMGTFDSTTSITAVDGAPTNNAILNAAASQADTALEKYGVVPTLTLRLGFDLI